MKNENKLDYLPLSYN